MKDGKRKGAWQRWLAGAVFMLVGGACGFLAGGLLLSRGDSPLESFLWFLGLIAGLYLACFLQILIHEAGHLVFGLLSGYRFCSFRIMSLMLVRRDDGLKLRRLSLAGTGGQCLMGPPDLVDGSLPVALYNLGGSLMNLIVSLPALGALAFLDRGSLFWMICLVFALVGLAFALMNGLPLHLGMVDNDGRNALSLSKDKAALRAFWIQLKTAEQQTLGLRLRDMPEEWFALPSDEEMKNPMGATMGVFACNRAMDMQDFDRADRLMERCLNMEGGMVGLHRSLLLCDRIYCLLLAGNIREAEALLTKEQRRFMHSMKNYPSVLRTNYAYALLGEGDGAKAEKYAAAFKKVGKSYPYPSEIRSETELMALARERAGAYGAGAQQTIDTKGN